MKKFNRRTINIESAEILNIVREIAQISPKLNKYLSSFLNEKQFLASPFNLAQVSIFV